MKMGATMLKTMRATESSTTISGLTLNPSLSSSKKRRRPAEAAGIGASLDLDLFFGIAIVADSCRGIIKAFAPLRRHLMVKGLFPSSLDLIPSAAHGGPQGG